ncbi:hypothetical protein HHI36_019473 [Cryptolaemus montrouzieri]|uniref:V-type proton ATPase subunit S1 n=1 Tax=Cryptolaemus montrouzieri TaxID=559131 RepID=A0ABD2P440_9CUCU
MKKMFIEHLFLIFLFCGVKLCSSTEYVPVYMWETQNSDHPVSSLQRISENSFKNTLSEKLKSNPFVVVFVEETLSPEDFAQRDVNGKPTFEALRKFLESGNVAYEPSVQNPVGAIKQLGKGVTEISVASLLRNFNVPKDEILIVDLNDAKDDELRTEMLKRHDSDISKIFDKLAEKNENILALYTAHHPSWIIPEEIKHRNARSLLQKSNENAVGENEKQGDNKKGSFITQDESLLLHVVSSPQVSVDGGKTFTNITLTTDEVTPQDNEVLLKLKGDRSYRFVFVFTTDGHWTLSNVMSDDVEYTIPDISVPSQFSYHCFNTTFYNGANTLVLPGVQMQPFLNKSDSIVFGDAFDCVGFTNIPIWTGLVVTLILLSILTFGITMIMDIRTMDRFDDAKGKTITVSVNE